MPIILNFSEAYYLTFRSIEPMYGADEAKAITKSLFREKYDISPLTLFTDHKFNHEEELHYVITRLMSGEPLQYVLGYTLFCGLKIEVDRNVLIPRPETEELVTIAKEFINEKVSIIADICTGSGCIALAMHAAFDTKKIIATDISNAALDRARQNDILNFKHPTVQFESHDILSMQWPFELPDVVICNPPYIGKTEGQTMSANVLNHEPHLALFVDDTDTLLFYKAVVKTCLPFKFPVICFEMNPLFSQAFRSYCEEQALQCAIHSDMQGKERFAIVTKI